MFQALKDALLIRSPIFKQMLFPVCSCKFYSRVPPLFYQRADSRYTAYLGCAEEALEPGSAQLVVQAAPSGQQPSTSLAQHCRTLQLSAAIHSSRRHRCAP